MNFSTRDMFSGSNLGDWPGSVSIDSNLIIDDIWKDTHACTHAHACNPPGADNTHTHTCYHSHSKLVVEEEDDDDEEDKVVNNNNNNNSNDSAESTGMKLSSKKRPNGNREAVRKYREKKKARAASLEDEVVKLRAVNQQLLKRLQSQAALEAEIGKLKCLLVDIRGRIEGEIGSFPYQKMANSNVAPNISLPSGYVASPCNGDLDNLSCLGNQDSAVKELSGCGGGNCLGNGVCNVKSSGARKRRGGPCAATAG